MKKSNMTLILALVLCVLALGVLAACGRSNDDTIRIGSKNFSENLIVAELYALALEDAGHTVERKFNVAGSLLHPAITNNEIDLYPEYTGTALLSILKMDVMTDPQEVYELVKREFYDRYELTWLNSTGVHNGQGLVLRTDVAERLGIRTISDLQRYADQIRFASQGEFDYREDGLPGLARVYGEFNFKSSTVYDNALKYQVLENNEADLAPAYTTDGQLSRTDVFTLLEDDLRAWPPYYLAPVVRNDLLEARADVADVLNRVSAHLNSQVMTELNAQVDVHRREFDEVAREFFNEIRATW